MFIRNWPGVFTGIFLWRYTLCSAVVEYRIFPRDLVSSVSEQTASQTNAQTYIQADCSTPPQCWGKRTKSSFLYYNSPTPTFLSLFLPPVPLGDFKEIQLEIQLSYFIACLSQPSQLSRSQSYWASLAAFARSKKKTPPVAASNQCLQEKVIDFILPEQITIFEPQNTTVIELHGGQKHRSAKFEAL